MNINVKSFDHGFFTQEDITVQHGYYEDNEFILELCNHAGREREEVTIDAGMHGERYEYRYFCNKCEAWYNELDDSWEAPQNTYRPASPQEIKGFVKAGGSYEAEV